MDLPDRFQQLPRQGRDLLPLIPQGVRCYFGEEVNRRRKAEAVLAAVARNWGFHEIILPFFDFLEDFAYGLGSQLGERVYRFLDKDGSLLALRPDLTTLVAKTVATRMAGYPLPIKLFYSGEVFRQERSGAGQQKEFYQIGLESMGVSAAWADIEILLIAVDCLQHLGVGEFKLALGHVGLFHGIVSGLEISSQKRQALREAIDHRDSGSLEQELSGLSLSEPKKRFLAGLPHLTGGPEVVEAGLSIVRNPQARRALRELGEIYSVFDGLGLGGRLSLDLGEVRGLDYYTGILFRIYSSAQGLELGGGGRYDGLPGKFGWDIPAVGFSFTLDNMLSLIGGAETLRVPGCEGDEFILPADGVSCAELFRRAWDLRCEGRCIHLGGMP
jgi:ATP phosphoribosyltransferase regulatory subunit